MFDGAVARGALYRFGKNSVFRARPAPPRESCRAPLGNFLPGSAGGVVAARVATPLSPSLLRAQRAIFWAGGPFLTVLTPSSSSGGERLTLT